MLDKELIKKINEKCPYNQGIFFQPFGIPDGIQEHVIYSSYSSGGMSGGSCWGDKAQPYTKETPKDHMAVLDILLTEIAPELTFLQYKRIQGLIKSNTNTKWEYYGNYTDMVIEYILVSDLEKLLREFKK